MPDLKTFLGVLSGLVFLQPEIRLQELVGTMFVVNVCDAIMCRLFAHNNGYPKTVWTVLGFIAGLWAVALLILLPRRSAPPSASRPLR